MNAIKLSSKTVHGKPNILLAAILIAVIVVPTGVSGTGVTLPHIAVDLGTNSTQLQWIVNGFNLTFAVFSLVAGSIADRLGRRRGLVVGFILFFIAAILSASAPNLLLLDFGRLLAGIGAAIIFSCAGALIAITFSGAAAARAFAMFGTSAGIGLGLGPTISSFGIAIIGWSGIFWFNAIAILLAFLILEFSGIHDKTVSVSHNLDYLGIVTFTVALTLIISGVVQGGSWGWHSLSTLAMLGIGISIFIAFIVNEIRSDHPLLDMSLLRSQRLVGLLLVPVAGAIGFVTLLTYYPTFLTAVWNLSSSTVGLVMLIMTLPVIIGPMLAGALHTKGCPAWIILGTSILLYIFGASSLLIINKNSDIPLLVIPFLLLGLGFGLGVGLVDGQAIQSVPEEKSGMVSGLVSTVRLGSEAIAVAMFASLLTTNIGMQVKDKLAFVVKQSDRKSLVDTIVSGDFSNIHLHFEISSLRDVFFTGFTPLVKLIALLSIFGVLIITSLLYRSKRQDKPSIVNVEVHKLTDSSLPFERRTEVVGVRND